MQAAIVAVGSELLGVDRLDTNSLGLTRVLRRYGVDLRSKQVLGDSVEDIASSLNQLSEEVDLVLVTGGLGPTADDVTRDAISAAFSLALETEPSILEAMEKRFGRFGTKMPEVNRRQALVPVGAKWIANRRGTAPGIELEEEECTFFFFPGVPRELEGMIESRLEPWLEERITEAGIEQRTLRVACLAESRVEELIAPAYDEMGRENITVLAKPGEIQVRVSASGPTASRAATLAHSIERLRDLVGDAAYGVDVDNDLETVVGGLLAARGATLATAESCTGGLVSERLTAVAGSSRYFLGGVVAYSNEAKESLLEIDREALEQFGAVSREVAIAMARGVLERFGADYGLAVTGVAGPGGGTSSKPVGTVHLVVVTKKGSSRHHQGRFPGHRERVRWLSSQWLLDLLRRELLGIEAVS